MFHRFRNNACREAHGFALRDKFKTGAIWCKGGLAFALRIVFKKLYKEINTLAMTNFVWKECISAAHMLGGSGACSLRNFLKHTFSLFLNVYFDLILS